MCICCSKKPNPTTVFPSVDIPQVELTLPSQPVGTSPPLFTHVEVATSYVDISLKPVAVLVTEDAILVPSLETTVLPAAGYPLDITYLYKSSCSSPFIYLLHWYAYSLFHYPKLHLHYNFPNLLL
jgi:hypothetical protein